MRPPASFTREEKSEGVTEKITGYIAKVVRQVPFFNPSISSSYIAQGLRTSRGKDVVKFCGPCPVLVSSCVAFSKGLHSYAFQKVFRSLFARTMYSEMKKQRGIMTV